MLDAIQVCDSLSIIFKLLSFVSACKLNAMFIVLQGALFVALQARTLRYTLYIRRFKRS